MKCVFVVLVLLWLTPATVFACPPPDCERLGYFGVDDDQEVPPNLASIPWAPDSAEGPSYPAPEEQHYRLLRDPDGEAEEVAVTIEGLDDFPWQVVPDDGFEEGQVYQLETACPRYEVQEFTESVRFSTSAESAESPQELGELRVVEQGMTSATVASSPACSVEAQLYGARVEVELSEGASPWAGALQFETFVTAAGGDEPQRWRPSQVLAREVAPGASWVGRGTDLLYTVCESLDAPSTQLEPGTYEVYMTASLPGEDWRLETNRVEIELECADEGGDDVGDPGADAGEGDTGTTNDNDEGRPEDGEPAAGCGCGTTEGTAPGLALILAGLLFGGAKIRAV